MTHEGDVPAMPCEQKFYTADFQSLIGTQFDAGFSQRQRAAIDLRWPDSGTPWIDSMIRASLRAEFAKAAMQGLLAASARSSVITEQAEYYARKLMFELEKGR